MPHVRTRQRLGIEAGSQHRPIDPVMADHGKVYPTDTPDLCAAMADLASDADLLTPNLTEAAIILGEPIGDAWGGENISDDEAHRIIHPLLARGSKTVVLKGIQRGDGRLGGGELFFGRRIFIDERGVRPDQTFRSEIFLVVHDAVHGARRGGDRFEKRC